MAANALHEHLLRYLLQAGQGAFPPHFMLAGVNQLLRYNAIGLAVSILS